MMTEDGELQEVFREDRFLSDETGALRPEEQTFEDQDGYISTTRDGSTAGAVIF